MSSIFTSINTHTDTHIDGMYSLNEIHKIVISNRNDKLSITMELA